MIFKILREFEVNTPSGTLTLKEGQKIRLSKEEAVPLIQGRFIQPIERVAHKVWSEILQAYLWAVDTVEDMHSLRSQGIAEIIYSHDEIKELRKFSKEDMREIHKVKEIFPESTIEEIKRNVDR